MRYIDDIEVETSVEVDANGVDHEYGYRKSTTITGLHLQSTVLDQGLTTCY
jgi:hypothetical protein